MRKLEVGSGHRPMPGYEHCDIDGDCPDLQYRCDMTRIPVPDCWFDEVRAVHCIEHVSIQRAREALLEWRRILVPGGLVYIDTPNIERTLQMYRDQSWIKDFEALTPAERDACSIHGTPSAALWINFKIFSVGNLFNLHYWNATPALLQQLLVRAGFESFVIIAESPSLICTAKKSLVAYT